MAELFKYRTLYGVITYKVIAGKIGDDILELEDTSCHHFGPNCIISVEKKYDHYEFKEALNNSANEYKSMHTSEPYFSKKQDALIWKIKSMLSDYNNDINKNQKRIDSLSSKLKESSSLIANYVTINNIELNTNYLLSDNSHSLIKVIGRIEYFDGRRGFLTDSNYDEYEENGYEDRIILYADEDGKIRCEETDYYVFPTLADYNNYIALKNNERIENEIARLKEENKKMARKILNYSNIVKEYEENNITYEKICEMVNETK